MYSSTAQSATAGNNITLLSAFLAKVAIGKVKLDLEDMQILAQVSGAILHLTQVKALAASEGYGPPL